MKHCFPILHVGNCRTKLAVNLAKTTEQISGKGGNRELGLLP